MHIREKVVCLENFGCENVQLLPGCRANAAIKNPDAYLCNLLEPSSDGRGAEISAAMPAM